MSCQVLLSPIHLSPFPGCSHLQNLITYHFRYANTEGDAFLSVHSSNTGGGNGLRTRLVHMHTSHVLHQQCLINECPALISRVLYIYIGSILLKSSTHQLCLVKVLYISRILLKSSMSVVSYQSCYVQIIKAANS